tara:strand:- start:385 stop:1200 length:816 start_codon:yes stop_codon:yes gene_type:complete
MKHTIAFIGGSGLAQGLERTLEGVKKVENIGTPFGNVLSYYDGLNNDNRVIILPRHGDSMELPSRSPAELVKQKGYEANIWQLHELGVEAIFGLSAVGSLDMDVPLASEGTFVVPNQSVRGCAASQHSFGNMAINVHPNMSTPFDPNLNDVAVKAILNCGYSAMKEGTYIYNGGDCFETPAEIRFLDKMTKGEPNRLVGMTTVPEAILSNQMNIPFVAICSNVNYAEGLSQQTLVGHEQTLDVMKKAEPMIIDITKSIMGFYGNSEKLPFE